MYIYVDILTRNLLRVTNAGINPPGPRCRPRRRFIDTTYVKGLESRKST